MSGVKLVIAVLLAAALAGCSTERLNLPVEHGVTKDTVSLIKKGKTTQEEVEEIFGKPLDRLVFPDYETWFYKDFNLRPIWIEFDDNGVVKKYKTDE